MPGRRQRRSPPAPLVTVEGGDDGRGRHSSGCPQQSGRLRVLLASISRRRDTQAPKRQAGHCGTRQWEDLPVAAAWLLAH